MNCNYVAMSLYFQPFIVPSYICVCIVVLFMYWFVKRNLFTEQTCTDSNTRQKNDDGTNNVKELVFILR